MLVAAGLVAFLVWAGTRSTRPVRSPLVLPSANLSTGEDSKYYSDGLTEELIGAFSRVRGLRVVPRTTAFQFKSKSAHVRSVGRQLETAIQLDSNDSKTTTECRTTGSVRAGSRRPPRNPDVPSNATR